MEELKDVKGYMKKLKSSSFHKFFGKTNLRYFETSFQNKTFSYKNSITDKNFVKNFSFSEILDVEDKIPEIEKAMCEYKYGFIVKLKTQTLILFVEKMEDFNEWHFAFDIILKRIPEAFPYIPAKVFNVALKLFYYPFLASEEEERIQLRKLEEDRKRREEEQKKWKIKEEEERKRKLQQEKEEEERLRRQRDEEEEKKNRRFKLYDDFHEVIIREAEDKSKQINSIENKDNKEILNKKVEQQPEINFKRDLDDWNFYDTKNKVIKEKELINFNYLLTKQNKILGTVFHSSIRGYIDPNIGRQVMNVESLHMDFEKKENILNNTNQLNETIEIPDIKLPLKERSTSLINKAAIKRKTTISKDELLQSVMSSIIKKSDPKKNYNRSNSVINITGISSEEYNNNSKPSKQNNENMKLKELIKGNNLKNIQDFDF
jgi:hypothetical protein